MEEEELIKKLNELTKEYPNDADLGESIRSMVRKFNESIEDGKKEYLQS